MGLTAGEDKPAKRVRAVCRDPLFLFLVAGALLFGLTQLYAGLKTNWARTIIVDSAVQNRLVELFSIEKGRAPRPEEAQALAHEYVRDEVLYREARKLGLDQDDEIVRRRLIQKITYLADDPASSHTPTVAELKAFYEANRVLFTTPARRSFHHVYFSVDRADTGAARAGAALKALNRGAQWESLGDRFALQSAYTALAAQDAGRIFGEPSFVQTLFSAPVGRWVGPVRSGYGWHLLYVDEALPERSAAFDAANPDLRAAFLEDRAEKARERAIDNMVKRYRVVVREPRGSQ